MVLIQDAGQMGTAEERLAVTLGIMEITVSN